ncbi:type II secretion system protein [bacterium]|nr:type II secretion system protein [bacterium]
MIKRSIKKGFSLAEVLITLTVIGIVAAITVPIIHKSADDEVTVAKVKKFHSTMSSAIARAVAENGSVMGWKYNKYGEAWNNESAEKFWAYLKPYITVMRDDCGPRECYNPVSMKLLNGESWSASYGTDIRYKKIVLGDGSVFWFRTKNSASNKCPVEVEDPNCIGFWYDVNGDKAPNTLGKDIFTFHLNLEKYHPAGSTSVTEYIPYFGPSEVAGKVNECINDGASDHRGWTCAAYILKNGNMKYLDE